IGHRRCHTKKPRTAVGDDGLSTGTRPERKLGRKVADRLKESFGVEVCVKIDFQLLSLLCLLWLLLSEILVQALSLRKLASESVNVIEFPLAVFQKENERRGPFVAGIVCLWSPLVKHVDDRSFAVTSGSDDRIGRRIIPRTKERAVAGVIRIVLWSREGCEFLLESLS